ncbi:MAG: MarR family transcriptional regulator [Sneathiella sp.]
MASYDLSQASFEVLTTLRAMPHPRPLTPTDLYNTILITSGGMTKVLKTLEEKGLIERISSDSDRRSRLVKITPAGAILIEHAMAAVIEGDKDLLSRSLPETQRQELKSILLQALEKLE